MINQYYHRNARLPHQGDVVELTRDGKMISALGEVEYVDKESRTALIVEIELDTEGNRK